MDNRLIATFARQGGIKLLDVAISRLLMQQPKPSAKGESTPPPSSPAKKATKATLGSVARRSVPAAIIIGGAVLAKALYDRRKAQQAAEAAENGGDAES